MQVAGFNTSFSDLLGIKSSQVNLSNLKNSGITSDNILENIGQYLVIFLIVTALFLAAGLLMMIPFFRKNLYEKFMKILKSFRFNNSILFISGVWLDFAFSISTQILVQKNKNWKFENISKINMILTWVILLFCMIIYIIFCFVMLSKNVNNLENE